MFETAVLSTGPQTKRAWTTLLGFAGQAMLLSCLVMGPMIWPQALPRVAWAMALAAPPAPPPPPLGPQVLPANRIRATHILRGLREPAAVPEHVMPIDDIADAAPAGAFVPGGVPNGSEVGVSDALIADIVGQAGRTAPLLRPPDVVKEPRVPPPGVVTRPPRITVLQMAEPIQRITPVYPPLARSVHVSGKVELMGVLGTDGRIREVKVLSGHPLLVKAAVDAVMQWLYRPTILNGQPVEVQAPITVTFILN